MENKNIVLVTVDSLRADKCGHLGGTKGLTPNLDTLARNGISFENAISPGPRTPDTLPALFTGHYPVIDSSGTINSEQEIIRDHLNRYETIAERLSRRGYDTAAFTPNPYTSRYFGYQSGFDYFEDFIDEDHSSALFEQILDGGSTSTVALRLLMSALQRENVFRSWETYIEDIEKWVEQAIEPYFLWVFLMDCHVPYLANRSNRTQNILEMLYGNVRWYWNDKKERFKPNDHDNLIQAYEDSIRHVDECIGRLQDTTSDSRFIVTADHGESFYEHKRYGHPPNYLYEENINVPLVIFGPDRQSTLKKPISIADIRGLLQPNGLPEIMPTNNVVYAQSLSGERIAARGETWKYIGKIDEGVVIDGEFYDLTADSQEETDISDESADIDELGKSMVRERTVHHSECREIRTAVDDLKKI